MSIVDPESGYREEPSRYSSSDELNDLAFIIAQMTAGFKGALPEQDDFEMAETLQREANRVIDDFYTD